MKDTLVKSVSSLLQPNGRDLQTVLSKVKAIKNLNDTLIPLLDPALQQYCQAANLTNGVLVILTANAAVATQLRYHTNDLLRKLHQNAALKHIREIQIKVRPATAPVGVHRGKTTKIPAKLTRLSPETAEMILAMAETIEDEELRAIMMRIAGHKT